MSTELKPQAISPSFFDTRRDTVVTWLGMAGALINARGTILFIDPLITTVASEGQPMCESGHRLKVPLPLEAEDVPRVDAVLYTHADGDHLGRLTAETFAARHAPMFLAPPPVGRILADIGIGEERIAVSRDFESIQVGQASVVITPALHDWQKEDPWQRGDCCGYLVHTPDGTIWHPGDTRLIDDLLAVRGVDVLFFDVAAVNAHLGPAGSARLAETCGAKALVAYHYGTFDLPPGTFGSCDPRDAQPYVEGLSARFLQLNPGEPLRLPLETARG
jgi:L-ascorbate metabolism protein UlaG (beta-lactamase superfamily)